MSSRLLSVASFFKGFGGVALAIVILLAMVTIHEFGHYVAGKILGFKINEFSVGFGPALFKKRSKKTGELFALRVIPLGGYCAFDGEDEEDEEEKKPENGEEPFGEMATQKEENEGGTVEANGENAPKNDLEEVIENPEGEYPEPKGERFNDQPPWKRIIVLLAGATMNYLLALFLLFAMFGFIGRPTYQVMDTPTNTETGEQYATQIQGVEGKSVLQEGDTIVEINGKDVYLITDYMSALEGKKAGTPVRLTVYREGKRQTVWIKLFADAKFENMSDTNALLVCMGLHYNGLQTQTVKQGFFPTIGHSTVYSFKIGGTVLRSLGELLTGKLGMNAVGGPVTTIKVTSEVAVSGWLSFLNIAALIGVNLAVFNLLPIPALDGCKVIFCIIEWIRKKPVNRKVEAWIHFAGIIFLLGFAILVDLLQLF